MAAAQDGQGRIVTFSHDGYSKKMFDVNLTDSNLVQLNKNVIRWVSAGHPEAQQEYVNLNDEQVTEEKLFSSKIAIWCGGDREKQISPRAVLEFIRNGGGFIHGMTPWGWLQLNPGKTLDMMPYLSVLKAVGLCYTDDYIGGDALEIRVQDNKASDAHLLRFLQANCCNPTEVLKKAAFVRMLQAVPKDTGSGAIRTAVELIWGVCCNGIEDCLPTSGRPTKSKDERGMLDMWQLCVDYQNMDNIKAPGCQNFPGDFTKPPPLTCATIEINSVREDFHSTGFYAPAGKTIIVEVISGNAGKNWSLIIGAHRDYLSEDNIRRWPKVQMSRALINNTYHLSSTFGGLIYLSSPHDEDSRIVVTLVDVVEAPQFILGENSVEQWRLRRGAAGLWADIIGNYVTITVPSSSIRELDDPTEVR